MTYIVVRLEDLLTIKCVTVHIPGRLLCHEQRTSVVYLVTVTTKDNKCHSFNSPEL